MNVLVHAVLMFICEIANMEARKPPTIPSRFGFIIEIVSHEYDTLCSFVCSRPYSILSDCFDIFS